MGDDRLGQALYGDPTVSGTNGSGRGQWLVNALFLVVIGLLGYWGVRLDDRVDQTETTAATADRTAATVKIENDTRWAEVLRRLDRIDRKLDDDQPRRGGR